MDTRQAGEERSGEVLLTDAARRRYPRAEVRYRRSYLAPNGSNDREKARPTWVMSLPMPEHATVGL